MRKFLIAAGIAISFYACSGASGETWYVDAKVSEPGDGKSWETAFNTIQRAIEEAFGGETVIVREGTYLENIRFEGKNIVLRSTDPLGPDVIDSTVIDGSGVGSVVTFAGAEDETCVLSGFTIRNGSAWGSGGISGNGTHATVQNNVITQNNGGSIGSCHGTIENNLITQNVGGLYYCDGAILNNTIAGNSASLYGGGLAWCRGTIKNNVIIGNSAWFSGGGLYACNGIIHSNTVYGNSAGEEGGGLYGCGGTIRNCIIWGNAAPQGAQLYDSAKPTYCCIQDWIGDLKTSTRRHPHLVDPEGGDYHLRSWSPCIDAGDPASDFSNEPQPNGGRINMGAYGNTPEAACKSVDSDSDGLPDDWETEFFRHLAFEGSDDPDHDLISNMEEYRRGLDPTSPTASWYVDCSVVSPGDGTSWRTAFKTVQEAVDVAYPGSVLVVAEGIYVENIHFRGENITLTSRDPLNPTVVGNTILDGNQSGPVVTFSGGKDEMCVVAGFTIQNGSARTGGGICGNGTNAIIRNNVITGNVAAGNGGGIHACHGTLQNNVITANSANYGGGVHGCDGIIQNNGLFGNSARYGGGLAECGGTVRRNSIRGNFADMYGGGLARCHGAIEDNIITGNSAGMYGGGLYGCQGTIECNTITANSADHGGGGLDFCCGIVQNNVIAGNWATWNGGGLYACDGTILNNTIVGNFASYCGGGLDYCCGTIQNSIVWANHASPGGQLSDSSQPTYSCIQDWIGGGEGNIADDPRFSDSDHDNFRLSPLSPCIDAGDNDAPDLPETDFAGMHRIMFGRRSLTVDMGAYEYYINDLRPGPTAEETILTWSSLADKTYSILYSADLVTWRIADDSVSSAGDMTTSWIDDGSNTGLPPSLAPRRFYRIHEDP